MGRLVGDIVVGTVVHRLQGLGWDSIDFVEVVVEGIGVFVLVVQL